jgi:poly(ADP-ribose) glycohydrolase ARH3
MRVAPVALFAFSDLPQVAQLARHTAIITHTHELGVEGAVLQARAVALRLGQEPHSLFDRQAFLTALHDHVRTLVFRDAQRQLLSLSPAASPAEVAQQVGNGIAAFEAVPAALYAFLCKAEVLKGW